MSVLNDTIDRYAAKARRLDQAVATLETSPPPGMRQNEWLHARRHAVERRNDALRNLSALGDEGRVTARAIAIEIGQRTRRPTHPVKEYRP